MLLAGNVAFHLEAHFEGAADVSIRVGIGVVVLLISLIGGRIIPSFTRNWLVKFNPGRLPVPFGRFDGVVIGLSALALIAWIVAPLNMITGVRWRSSACCIWCGSRAGPVIAPRASGCC